MRHRKLLCLFLALMLCVSLLPVSAAAETAEAPNTAELAGSLKALGLFQGVSDTDFDLGRAPTRAEALVMLLRLTGKAAEAAAWTGENPLSDRGGWADPYVAYAWDHDLTRGRSDGSYGVSAPASAKDYLTFVLRALGYSDAEGDFSWNDPFDLAEALGILPAGVDRTHFLRADVALVSYAALTAQCKGSEKTLAQTLMGQGALSAHDYSLYFDPDAVTRGGMKPSVADAVTLKLDPDRVSRGIDITGMEVRNYSYVLQIGDGIYEKYGYYPSLTKNTADKIKNGAAAVAGQARVFVLGAPNRLGAVLSYDDFFRLSGSSGTETDGNAAFYEQCGEGVIGVNAVDRLRLHNDENIFFRTDHHWTALGAYYAYTAWAEAAGFDPVPLNRYEKQDRGNFLGSFYSDYDKPQALGAHPDNLTVYIPRSSLSVEFVGTNGNRWTDDRIVFDYDNYGTFLLGDHQLVTITNNDIDDDSACVLVKDSYGNPFAVYLTQHYHTVYVIDYRHYKGMPGYLTFSRFAAEKGVDDFIVLLPMSMQGSAAGQLGYYCK